MLLLDVGSRRWRILLLELFLLVFFGAMAAAPFTWLVYRFVKNTPWERAAWSVGNLAIGTAIILALRAFGTRYVTRLERQGADLHISTFGLLSRERTLNVRVTDVTLGPRHEWRTRDGAPTPWRALSLPGYRMPFILDLMAPVLNEQVRSAKVAQFARTVNDN